MDSKSEGESDDGEETRQVGHGGRNLRVKREAEKALKEWKGGKERTRRSSSRRGSEATCS